MLEPEPFSVVKKVEDPKFGAEGNIHAKGKRATNKLRAQLKSFGLKVFDSSWW